jgi:hypothetical protein
MEAGGEACFFSNKFGGGIPTNSFIDRKDPEGKLQKLTTIISASRGEKDEIGKAERENYKIAKGEKGLSTSPSNTLIVTSNHQLAQFPSTLRAETALITSGLQPRSSSNQGRDKYPP